MLFTRLFHRKGFKENNPDDKFRRFHRIIVNYRRFFIPSDLTVHDKETNEELLVALLNGNTKALLEYDYTRYEDRAEMLNDLLENYLKELAKKSHNADYISKKDKLKEEYCKYKPNRDYNDIYKEITLKRPDEIDGYYINNGYR